MDEMEIRRAEPADAAAAWAIVGEYYDAVDVMVREDPQTFLRYYFGEGSGCWLARRNGAVVGCIALRPLDGLEAAAEVKRLYVQPSSRGFGIAALLLQALHTYARGAGYEWLYLDSKDDLKAALAFYEKHGYTHCARYNDNPQATVFMRKRISFTRD
jgi:GNAT superfamily N-acetyltransferase